MARPPSSQPTEGEIEILKVLWRGGPSELGAVCSELRRRRPAATTTVATMLGVMLKKGLVRRAIGPRGYVWTAALTSQLASSGLLRRLVDLVFDGSTKGLVLHLIEHGKLNARERKEIEDLLAAYRAKKGKA